MTDAYAGIGAEDPYAQVATADAGSKVASAAPSTGTDGMRWLALGGRALGEGVFDTLALPHDLGIGMQNLMRRGWNAVTGRNAKPAETFAGNFSNALTDLGAATPQTENEQTGSALMRGVSGALTGGGIIGSAAPALNTTSNLVRTGISGATSAGASEATRRNGGGSVAQFLASLAGGAVPFLGSGIPRPQPQVPPAQATASATATATPQVTARGGGGFGSVGADPSAGLTPAQQQLAQWGQEQGGFRLTPGQVSGSRALQQFEAKLESQPMTSGPFNTLKSGNQQQLNRHVAASIGEDSTTLDATVLGRANDRLGDVFESVRTPDRVVMQDPAATTRALDAIDAQMEGLIPGTIRDNPLVKRLEALTQSGQVNGEQLGSLTSKLGKAAYKQMSGPNGDRDLGQALYAVKDHVDDLIQSTLSPQEAQTYAQARQQYRNLMLITSRTGIVNPSTGNVAGGALANKLQTADRRGFLFGGNQSDMYNAARFAQAFKPVVGDSGTATRSMIHSPLDLALSIPTNLAARAYLSLPPGIANIRNAAARGISPRGLLNPLLLPGVSGGLLGEPQQ